MALIQDVIAPPNSERLFKAQRQADINYIKHVEAELLVTEVYSRGISVHDVFGMFYALEAMAYHRDDLIFGSSEAGQHGKQLTVGDAELAGLTPTLPTTPLDRQTF